MRSMTLGLILVLFSTLVGGVACSGGGGGDGDGGGGGGGGAVCVSFEAGAAAAAGTASSAQGGGSVCNTVIVEISLTDVNDVFAVSFDANYNTNIVSYKGYSLSGSQLSSDGAQLQVIENATAGQVSLGVTRINTAVGVNFTGTQRVLQLMFSRASGVGAGKQGSLSYANALVLDSATPPQPKPGINWFGGTFRTK